MKCSSLFLNLLLYVYIWLWLKISINYTLHAVGFSECSVYIRAVLYICFVFALAQNTGSYG